MPYPTDVNPEYFRLVAPFESEQIKWKDLMCINIADPNDHRKYGLTTSFTSTAYGQKAVIDKFENLLHQYSQHPEAKSLGPDGEPCRPDTRGLLGRTHIIAGRHRRISKESIRSAEEGDDLESLEFVPMEYEQPGDQKDKKSGAKASERLIRKIKKIGIRKLVRYRLGRRILEKICRRELINLNTLREYEQKMRQFSRTGD